MAASYEGGASNSSRFDAADDDGVAAVEISVSCPTEGRIGPSG